MDTPAWAELDTCGRRPRGVTPLLSWMLITIGHRPGESAAIGRRVSRLMPLSSILQGRKHHDRALLILFQLRLVVQHGVEQRTVDFDVAVVADQAELAELVPELTDARPCGATHVRQCLLADIRGDWL